LERQIRDEIKAMCLLIDRLSLRVLEKIAQNNVSIDHEMLKLEDSELAGHDVEFLKKDYQDAKDLNALFRNKIIDAQHDYCSIFNMLEAPRIHSTIEVSKAMNGQLSALSAYVNNGSCDSPNTVIESIPR